jgi:hypothetical protein
MFVSLARDEYYEVLCARRHRVVLLVRSAARYPAVNDVRQSFELIEKAIASVDRSRFTLVFDVRRGVLRNDPLFESVMAPCRRRVQAGFYRRCVLVATKLGAMQIARHAESDPFQVEIFDSPDALAAALGSKGELKF